LLDENEIERTILKSFASLLTHDIEEFNKTNKRVVRFINIGFTERWDIRRLFSIDKKP
jgi:hypothetical protein